MDVTGGEAPSDLPDAYGRVRATTERLASVLSAEDQTVQSMPDVSPTKWHRAHTTWFFESFLLVPSLADYRVFHSDYAYLFNSYYEGVGAHHPRANRGFISRPGVQEVAEYRCHVDEAMVDLFDDVPSHLVLELAELGIQHEQQHQELLLMDIKHVLSRNPMQPAFDAIRAPEPDVSRTRTWTTYGGGNYDIGYSGASFCFDNELPRHRVHLAPFVYQSGWGYRRWAVGAVLPPLFLTADYYYADWATLGLDPPQPGFQWVRYGPDLLLVNVTTGEVVDTIYDAFE